MANRHLTIGHRLLFDGAAQLFDSIPVEVTGAPTDVAMFGSMPIARARVDGKQRVAPYLFRPLLPPVVVPAPLATPFLGWQPSRGAKIDAKGRRAPYYFAPHKPPTFLPPYGPALSSVLVLDVEAGGAVTFAWATNVIENNGGQEYRRCVRARARSTWSFPIILNDQRSRDVRSRLIRGVALGRVFGLALPYEAIYASDDASGSTFNAPTAFADWAIARQPVAVVGFDGSIIPATIQSVTGTTVVIDQSIAGVCARAGARMMPIVPVFLEAAQPFGRYAVNAEQWTIEAIPASTPGFVNSIAVVGASVTYAPGGDPLFDRGLNVTDGTNATGWVGKTDLVDLGSLLEIKSNQSVADGTRQIKYRSASRAEWQWLKLFLATVRGRNKRFVLPTGRPDLVGLAIGGGGTTLDVEAPPAAYAADYLNEWYPSIAHRLLQLVWKDGTYDLIFADGVTDLGTGVQRIALDTTASQAFANLARISFAETVRLDTDEPPITWNATTFAIDVTAKVVQQ
jgi:hypothetical protein